jgi:hypothetical protein
MSIVVPLLITEVNGRPVRYFRSQLVKPDLPWHAVVDFFAAMGLSDEAQLPLIRLLRGEYRNDTRIVVTTEGPALIGPMCMALGPIRGLHQKMEDSLSIEQEYVVGLAAATDVQVSDASADAEALARHVALKSALALTMINRWRAGGAL